ncbi:hypothetical protein H112_08547 [Trichophyton rubrum D6]|uniref:Protein kinase domain-containing protein n=3 Tax=Trichophyton TaxID=5550 RepID=F2SF11_TRIRC|nr:uncharacterized protein TERG_01105 [Trichophyton rubrum CBS 118892]EZF10131.1 hypothetical protein H100_08570 [Trichophyton rubrum MR850]EZF37047.1 hypothetical protein H102_08529 [Trichophyton rubrum CBS 100081]EZF47822.1 hypothetical protein H103_08551 [Trichophyton rubrum CBS 288.86]EZF58339.1 hypothetical protein H104_08503 [Trichophyton rubrum CBS 289.86]EZF68893.1 hypothetical protein H105_08558 [Trichophyton soudanense CBS 452.61]EZF79625.1 hypothetical protein H110_08553 [Trichophy
MRSLFDGTLAKGADISSQQIDNLGISSLPPQWWERWDARHEYFDKGGIPPGNCTVNPLLEQAFVEEIQAALREKGVEAFSEEEKAAVLAIFRSMLVFDHEKRASARSLLASDWMMN